MPLRRTLELTDSQRQDLQHYRDHDPRPYVRERCAALLKIADGQSPHAVARQGLLKPRHPDTLYDWLNWYERLGIRSVWWFHMVASIGWGFDRTEELIERLQHAPGEEARQELAPTPDGPAPSRWTLRGVRATFPWLKHYTLSGVWRLLHRHGLHIRAAQVRQHSPDPDYLAKLEHLLSCLRDAAAHP